MGGDQAEGPSAYSISVDLSGPEWKVVKPILSWLRAPLDIWLADHSEEKPKKFRMTKQLAEAFGLQLRLFHALHSPQEVLTKKPFEFALEAALNGSGFSASIDDNTTTPGADIVINGEGFSVKTEAGLTTSKQVVFLTKLMESAWTKNLTKPEQFIRGVHENVLPRVLRSDRTLVWRCFRRLSDENAAAEYELLEIPKSYWEAMANIQAAQFKRLTAAGSTSVPVGIGGETLYTLSFDGSDQKIQIRNLAVDRCIVHGRWQLEAPVS
jgi:hypothetical protein